MTMAGDEPQFDWSRLVPHFVHPVKVATIEAIRCTGRPLSPPQLHELFNSRFTLAQVSYHARRLAQVGGLVEFDRRQVRGGRETYYSLPEGERTWERA